MNYTFIHPFRPPLLVITLDDANATDFTIAYKELKSRMVKGSCYLVTNNIGNSGKLTWDHIKKMVSSGWDMECHTHTHANLTLLDEAGIRAEMEAVNAAFAAQGLATPTHHAYPWGESNALVKQIVGEYRQTQRTVRNQLNMYSEINIIDLNGTEADPDTTPKLNTLKAMIDDAVVTNGILITLTHDLTNTTIKNNFLAMIDYAIAQKMRIATLTEMQSRLFS